MLVLQGFSLAVLAGLFAALASVSSKLAFEDGGRTLRHIVCRSFSSGDLCGQVSL